MRLTSTQRSVLSDFLTEARRRGASPKETKALVEAGLVEANLGNPRYGDRDSLGSLQQRPSQGWGSAAQVLNPRYAASKFLSSAKQANRPGISAAQLAQAVQRSAFPGRYQERSGQAESLLSGRRSGSTTTTTTTPGVDRAPERQALLLSYLDQRNNPDALLNLASGLKANQDTPGSSRTVQRKTQASHFADAGGGAYPTAKHGKVIGTPYQGTHTLGNWQSDNAVDIAVPFGTPIIARTAGKIRKTGGQAGTQGRFAGFNLTLDGHGGNAYFYTHLSKLSVRPGQSVKKGQVIGYSGAANGVNHLHFGVEHGNPLDLLGLR